MKVVTELKVPIDILVNNAGIARFRPFVMSKVDDFKEMMQVNLYAPVQISQYVVKNMLKQRKGSIINFCSVSGLDSNSGNAAYGASKAAIASLTRTMAKELAKVNIRVNAVAPGFVATDMNKQIDADYMESMLPQIALERVADVSEVANTVLFLASDESSYLTGQVIRIDGGM
jgi:3-oxoacyl-[acyl-carrier protein] reductase